MAKRIIVTAGATQEPVDSVRNITNFSTGRLGAAIADSLIDVGFDVCFIHGQHSAMPLRQCLKISVKTVKQASDAIREQIISKNVKAVIHSMAVSDFHVSAAVSFNEIYRIIKASSDERHALQTMTSQIDKHDKLSSDQPQMLLLVPGEKIIDQIKKWRNDNELYVVSFKLLAGSTKQKLFEKAKGQLLRTGSNLVVANLLEKVSVDNHQAWLIDRDSCKEVTGKKQIANELAKRIEYNCK